MKRALVFISSLLLLIAIGACKKAKGPANGKSVQQNNNIDSTVSMVALVNRANWQTDSAFGYLIRSSANDSGVANLMITATSYANSTPTTISFNIQNYTGPNTYNITPPVNQAAYYVGNTRHEATTGSITISMNMIISRGDTGYALIGNFSFTADTVTVTNGSFDIAQP